MLRTRLHSACLSAVVIAGALCLSPIAAPQGDADPFPVPEEGIVIRTGEDGMKLLELVELFGEVTGENIILSADTSIMLNATSTGLLRDLAIAPQSVYAIVETILIANRFVVSDLRRDGNRVLSIASLDSPQRSNVRGDARYVPIEELAYYVNHPAVLVQTTLSLPHMDVRTMGNSMRAFVVDPNTMQMIAVPESRSLILIGFGPRVHDLSLMLKKMDADAAASQKERKAAEVKGE